MPGDGDLECDLVPDLETVNFSDLPFFEILEIFEVFVFFGRPLSGGLTSKWRPDGEGISFPFFDFIGLPIFDVFDDVDDVDFVDFTDFTDFTDLVDFVLFTDFTDRTEREPTERLERTEAVSSTDFFFFFLAGTGSSDLLEVEDDIFFFFFATDLASDFVSDLASDPRSDPLGSGDTAFFLPLLLELEGVGEGDFLPLFPGTSRVAVCP